MTADRVLALAASQLGIKESPAGSNNVKYNTAYYGRTINNTRYHWCAVFIWWLFRELGASSLYYGGGKTASCTTLYRYHRNAGQAVYGDYKPGDIIFFDFSGKKIKTEHVGICEICDGKYITTIDGNTGTMSEANGGAVMRRTRELKYVSAAYRPAYQEDKPMTLEDAKTIIKEKAGLSDTTITYLWSYRWGDDLLLKLAQAMEGE